MTSISLERRVREVGFRTLERLVAEYGMGVQERSKTEVYLWGYKVSSGRTTNRTYSHRTKTITNGLPTMSQIGLTRIPNNKVITPATSTRPTVHGGCGKEFGAGLSALSRSFPGTCVLSRATVRVAVGPSNQFPIIGLPHGYSWRRILAGLRISPRRSDAS